MWRVAKRVTPPTSFLWVSYPLEWLFFTLVRQTYRNPPPLPWLGTGYVETTRESLPVNTGGVKDGTKNNSLFSTKIKILSIYIDL